MTNLRIGHVNKNCPSWKDIKSKEKREQSKKDQKKVMLVACWGEFESDEDEDSDKDNIDEANICLTTFTHHVSSPNKDKQRCFMAKPSNDSSNDEEEEKLMDSKNYGAKLKHLDKQNELLQDAHNKMSFELHRLQVEEEMLMRKLYEVSSALGLDKKSQVICGLVEEVWGSSTFVV